MSLHRSTDLGHLQPKISDFNPFYHHNTLLIQLIVNEFIQTYRLNLQFNMLLQEQIDSDESLHSLSPSFTHLLGQLVGQLACNDRAPLSQWTHGPLTKFKEFCNQLSRNSSHQNKSHHQLYILAHQAWLAVVHNFELLKSLDTHTTVFAPPANLFSTPLKQTSYHLQMRLNQISRLLPRVVSAYWEDENVALFLLRKNELLKEIYGPNALYKRFKCPIKESTLITTLVNRYEIRGFEALLPTIHKLLESKDHIHEIA